MLDRVSAAFHDKPPRVRALARADRRLAVVDQIARLATAELEPPALYARFAEILRRGGGWSFVLLAALDLRSRRLRAEAVSAVDGPPLLPGSPCDRGPMAEVALTGRAVLVGDARQAPFEGFLPDSRALLALPVRHRDEVLGVLWVESARPVAVDLELPLLTTAAAQLAGIVATARLTQELARRAALLEMMSEISHAALLSDQLDEVLDRICQFLLARFALVDCAVLLQGKRSDELLLQARAGQPAAERRRRGPWPVDRGIVGRAFRTGQPQWVPDVSADPDYVAGHPAVRSEFVVPIRFHDRLLGLLNLEADHPDAFSPENRILLRALADQVAGAIHLAIVNQRLLESVALVEEKSEQIERANERLRVANDQLERLSNLDGLTGIANRRQFDAALDREWRRARRRGHPLSLLLIDIDHFKAYNDTLGHLAGDEALRRVAVTLAQCLRRAEDLIARYGGEEFAVLLPDSTLDGAMCLAEQLRVAVSELAIPHPSAPAGRVTLSIGAAEAAPASNPSAQTLIDRADQALYAAKSGGRDRTVAAPVERH